MVDIVRDKYATGLAGGFLGGVVIAAISNINVHLVHFASIPYYQWAAGIIYNGTADNIWEITLAQVVQVAFAAGLGIPYAMLFSGDSLNYRLKGLSYGWASWFVIYSLAVLLKMPTITKLHFSTVFSNFVTSGIYGFILAEFVRWADKKWEARQ